MLLKDVRPHLCVSVSVQFRAGEHPGGSLQPQQPVGDVGAAAGGV